MPGGELACNAQMGVWVENVLPLTLGLLLRRNARPGEHSEGFSRFHDRLLPREWGDANSLTETTNRW